MYRTFISFSVINIDTDSRKSWFNWKVLGFFPLCLGTYVCAYMAGWVETRGLNVSLRGFPPHFGDIVVSHQILSSLILLAWLANVLSSTPSWPWHWSYRGAAVPIFNELSGDLNLGVYVLDQLNQLHLFFFFFWRDDVSLLPRLVLNSWVQIIFPPQIPN